MIKKLTVKKIYRKKKSYKKGGGNSVINLTILNDKKNINMIIKNKYIFNNTTLSDLSHNTGNNKYTINLIPYSNNKKFLEILNIFFNMNDEEFIIFPYSLFFNKFQLKKLNNIHFDKTSIYPKNSYKINHDIFTNKNSNVKLDHEISIDYLVFKYV